MLLTPLDAPPRQRAPSKRALETKARIFDAAEKLFAHKGFDGATIRDIAGEAGVPVGAVNHHGGSKEALFHRTVARRAEELSRLRLDQLSRLNADGPPSPSSSLSSFQSASSSAPLTVREILSAFIRPFFDLCEKDPRWRDYARLVAFVSADVRWLEISAACFDPTAEVFLEALVRHLPKATRSSVAVGFAYAVSVMLAQLTSDQRITALGAGELSEKQQFEAVLRFCGAGLAASCA